METRSHRWLHTASPFRHNNCHKLDHRLDTLQDVIAFLGAVSLASQLEVFFAKNTQDMLKLSQLIATDNQLRS